MNIGICTEDAATCAAIQGYLRRFSQATELDCRIEELTQPVPAAFDVLFIDLDLEPMGRLLQAHRIREADRYVRLILVSQTDAYAAEGYGLEAAGYLLKPVEVVPFCNALQSSVTELRRLKKQILTLSTRNGLRRIYQSEILYAHQTDNGVQIVCDNHVLLLNGKLEQFKQSDDRGDFAWCNHNTLVNLGRVVRLSDRQVTVGMDIVRVSNSHAGQFKRSLLDYYGMVNVRS